MFQIDPVFPCALDVQSVYLTCRIQDVGDASWSNLDVWGHCPPHEAPHLRLSRGGQGERYVGWKAPLSHVVLQRVCFRPLGALAGRIYYLLDTRLSDYKYVACSPDFPARFTAVLNEGHGESVAFSSLEVIEMSELEISDTGYLFSREIFDRQDIFDRNKCSNNECVFESSAYFDDEYCGWCLAR